MTEREAYIGFSAFPGIGPRRFKLLTNYFGNALSAWNANKEILLKIGLGNKLTSQLIDFRQKFSSANFVKELLQKEINILTRIDKNYPALLNEISDPPIALYQKGKMPENLEKAIGVVGTRKPTEYGKNITQSLTRDLVLQNFIIISGLARGVDSIAHKTALEQHGITVAVLGCGVDIIYPPENKNLYFDIIKNNGAVISEVPPGHLVLKGLFPARNRIISGLSKGILVTEGAFDSGSLITANYAADQGKEIFAVPGPITSYLSEGPVKLIKNGAKLVTDVKDILEEFNYKFTKNINLSDQKKYDYSFQQKQILELLRSGELHFDDIVRISKIDIAKLGSELSILELNGIIRSLGNGRYGLK